MNYVQVFKDFIENFAPKAIVATRLLGKLMIRKLLAIRIIFCLMLGLFVSIQAQVGIIQQRSEAQKLDQILPDPEN